MNHFIIILPLILWLYSNHPTKPLGTSPLEENTEHPAWNIESVILGAGKSTLIIKFWHLFLEKIKGALPIYLDYKLKRN